MYGDRKRILFSAILILSIVTTIAALREQSKKDTTSNKKEDVTVVQEGVMTERQKQHSKLYGRSGGRNLRNAKKSLNVVITPPFIEPDNDKTSSTIEGLLQRITCDADAVVVGIVTSKTSQFTEDGSFVFTDYEMQVEEILKNNPQIPMQQGGSIVITRPGGAVELNSKVIRVIDKSFQPLGVGDRYLLFLQQIPSSGAYQAVNSESSFQLDQNQVRRVSARQIPYPFTYGNNAASLLAQVRTIGGLCNNRLNGGAK